MMRDARATISQWRKACANLKAARFHRSPVAWLPKSAGTVNSPPGHSTLKGKRVMRARPFATAYPRWSIACTSSNVRESRNLRYANSMRASDSFQMQSTESIASCQRLCGAMLSPASAVSSITAIGREIQYRRRGDSARLDLYLRDRETDFNAPA